MLAGMDVSINPGLYAMEGSLRRIPDSAHVREELAWATARIARALPKAKLMVGAQSVQGIAGLIEDSRVSLERELRFLLKVAPTLESPIRSEEHTSELQSLMRLPSAVFCLKKKHKHLYKNYSKPVILFLYIQSK